MSKHRIVRRDYSDGTFKYFIQEPFFIFFWADMGRTTEYEGFTPYKFSSKAEAESFLNLRKEVTMVKEVVVG